MLIRIADPDRDSAFCADIYASYVLDTSISFEYEPPNADEFASRINASLIWLVAEQGNEIVGYAYAAQHRERAAYQWGLMQRCTFVWVLSASV
ncbi:MAG: GNAT family N-acetyltransferase [Acidimicrobiia bacterium]